jgi:hypothetical protein
MSDPHPPAPAAGGSGKKPSILMIALGASLGFTLLCFGLAIGSREVYDEKTAVEWFFSFLTRTAIYFLIVGALAFSFRKK